MYKVAHIRRYIQHQKQTAMLSNDAHLQRRVVACNAETHSGVSIRHTMPVALALSGKKHVAVGGFVSVCAYWYTIYTRMAA